MKDSTAKRWKQSNVQAPIPGRLATRLCSQSARAGPPHPAPAPGLLTLRPSSSAGSAASTWAQTQICLFSWSPGRPPCRRPVSCPSPASHLTRWRRRPISLRPHLSPHLQEPLQSRAPQRLLPDSHAGDLSPASHAPSPVTALNHAPRLPHPGPPRSRLTATTLFLNTPERSHRWTQVPNAGGLSQLSVLLQACGGASFAATTAALPPPTAASPFKSHSPQSTFFLQALPDPGRPSAAPSGS